MSEANECQRAEFLQQMFFLIVDGNANGDSVEWP